MEAIYDCLPQNAIIYIHVYTLGDNISMLKTLGKDNKEVNIRNSVAKTKALDSLIVNKYQGVGIYFGYIEDIPGVLNIIWVVLEQKTREWAVGCVILWLCKEKTQDRGVSRSP